MIIGIPKESAHPGETRVAISPETAAFLISKKKHRLIMESEAGVAAGFSDSEYVNVGVEMAKDLSSLYSQADIVLKVQQPAKHPNGKEEIGMMKAGALLISFFWPLSSPELVKSAAKRGISVMAVDSIPRITRAQRMDALSSQTNIAGYKAVIIAANNLRKIFPLLMTAAGTVTPAKVVIIGAGVAGLQAVATARRLGAIVNVSDVRPAVKEQVESLGGRYIEISQEEGGGEGEGGYAREATAEFLQKQQELLAKYIAEADAVITTALVPGKKAPILVSRQLVESMSPGAVIVDMAAEQGGNCELTKAGKAIEHNGVKIIGVVNLPASLPYHASQLYSRNIGAVVEHISSQEGELHLDLEDEIIQGALIVHKGEIIHPKVKEILS